MKPAPFAYHAPETLDQALELADSLDNARVLAGGQSLVPMLNLRLAQPDHVIDLGHIPALAGLETSEHGLSAGAMTTQRSIERSRLVAEHCPLLLDALHFVGHQQTRNRGTIGGSLCHLDPAAELPVVAMALDPVLTVASRSGQRAIRFRDFPLGYLTSQLEPNEILLRIEFPPWRSRTGWAFAEFARRPADFAIVSVAVTLTADPDGRIEEARIALGGLGGAPVRAGDAEACLAGARLADRLDEAIAAVRTLPTEGDLNHPADYRQDLADMLTRRALAQAWERARQWTST
jgi:CO/xanthine dehydrogenase FAD-binding subunit